MAKERVLDPEIRACENCEYWDWDGEKRCHKNPPQLFVLGDRIISKYPKVKIPCGEFIQRIQARIKVEVEE